MKYSFLAAAVPGDIMKALLFLHEKTSAQSWVKEKDCKVNLMPYRQLGKFANQQLAIVDKDHIDWESMEKLSEES